jgi:hypothetical protein
VTVVAYLLRPSNRRHGLDSELHLLAHKIRPRFDQVPGPQGINPTGNQGCIAEGGGGTAIIGWIKRPRIGGNTYRCPTVAGWPERMHVAASAANTSRPGGNTEISAGILMPNMLYICCIAEILYALFGNGGIGTGSMRSTATGVVADAITETSAKLAVIGKGVTDSIKSTADIMHGGTCSVKTQSSSGEGRVEGNIKATAAKSDFMMIFNVICFCNACFTDLA